MILLFISLVTAKSMAQPDLYRQLSVRDGSPPCRELQQQHFDLQNKLKILVSDDVKPSSVPIRAASCLLELYPQDLETYHVWMEKKETLGLAKLTVLKFDVLPVDISASLAQKALEGENASKLLPSLQKILIPEVALVVSKHMQSTETTSDSIEEKE